ATLTGVGVTTRARTVGEFELLDTLGAGGMGEAWRARHRSGQLAAVKILHSSRSSARVREDCLREIEAAASLTHPNIVKVLDAGTDEQMWIAMELVDGVPLDEASRTLNGPTQQRLLLVLLDALAHAHARGVV